MARIERMSFDAYNESDVLVSAVKRYKARTGHYPELVRADQIYKNRINRAFCKAHGIRISEPALGRPKKNRKANKKRSTGIMLTELLLKEHLRFQSTVMDLGL